MKRKTKERRPIVQIPASSWSKGLADALRREGYFPICLRGEPLKVLDVEPLEPPSVLLHAAMMAIRDSDTNMSARTHFGENLAVILADKKP